MSGLRLVPPEEEPPREGGPGAEPPARSGRDADGDEDDNSWSTNVAIAVAVILVIGIGIWLVDALLEQRRLDDCAAQGRRNCAGISMPAR